MEKVAVFSMDVEAFFDSKCIMESNIDTTITMKDGIDNYLSILNKHNIKASTFIVVNSIPYMKNEIEKIAKNGHSIGLHGLSHVLPEYIDNDKYSSDLKKAKEILENEYTSEVIGYRAPCFSMSPERLKIISDLGFKYDSSFMNTNLKFGDRLHRTDLEKVSDSIYKKDDIYEFEISTSKKVPVSGGGYARLLPWLLFRAKFIHYIRKHSFYTFYVHPFELSNQKPPKFKDISFIQKLYIKCKRGNAFAKRIEKMILLLKKEGYVFKTFEQIIKEKQLLTSK